jgi:hypothetical protein
LIFIAASWAPCGTAGGSSFRPFVERYARPVTTHAIGIVAGYWFIERLAGLQREIGVV